MRTSRPECAASTEANALLSRRGFVVFGGLSLGYAALAGCATPTSTERGNLRLAAIESAHGGRLGVAALELSSEARLEHRADERFALCSTFKWLLGAFVLKLAESGTVDLAARIRYTQAELVSWSPVTEQNLADGMEVVALCEAMMTTSDNTAANLLLRLVGGPQALTRYLRDLGDPVTRLDRYEPMLNDTAPDDPRDKTTPAAMLFLMREILFGNALTTASRGQLQSWMIDNRTGRKRLRAGFDESWTLGNRTGTHAEDQSNDLLFAIPEPPHSERYGRILIASYLNAPNPMTPKSNAVHASVAREVLRGLGG